MNKYSFKLTAIITTLIALDQYTKYLSLTYLSHYVHLIGPIGFMHHQNTGVAFSMPIPSFITIPLAFLVSLFLLKNLIQRIHKNIYEYIGFLLIFCGAIGNMLDRIFFGYVIDFFVVYSFPIFNIADVYITWGIIFLIISELIQQIQKNTE
jgi:signal peptidase II